VSETKDAFSDLLSDHSPERLQKLVEEIHSRYHRLIYHLFNVFHIAPDQRADLFNQIFIKIMKGLERIKHYDNIKSWVITIAKNEIFSFLHKLERELRLGNSVGAGVTSLQIDNGAESHLFPPERDFFSKQLQAVFQQSIAELSEEIRRPFLMRYREHMKWREIGSVMGLTADTARKRAEKARRKLLRDVRNRLGIDKLL